MMHFTDLSIATTTHNNYQMLADMLGSFETNLGTVDKIVIVDDGSRRPCHLPPVSSGVRLMWGAMRARTSSKSRSVRVSGSVTVAVIWGLVAGGWRVSICAARPPYIRFRSTR